MTQTTTTNVQPSFFGASAQAAQSFNQIWLMLLKLVTVMRELEGETAVTRGQVAIKLAEATKSSYNDDANQLTAQSIEQYATAAAGAVQVTIAGLGIKAQLSANKQSALMDKVHAEAPTVAPAPGSLRSTDSPVAAPASVATDPATSSPSSARSVGTRASSAESAPAAAAAADDSSDAASTATFSADSGDDSVTAAAASGDSAPARAAATKIDSRSDKIAEFRQQIEDGTFDYTQLDEKNILNGKIGSTNISLRDVLESGSDNREMLKGIAAERKQASERALRKSNEIQFHTQLGNSFTQVGQGAVTAIYKARESECMKDKAEDSANQSNYQNAGSMLGETSSAQADAARTAASQAEQQMQMLSTLVRSATQG